MCEKRVWCHWDLHRPDTEPYTHSCARCQVSSEGSSKTLHMLKTFTTFHRLSSLIKPRPTGKENWHSDYIRWAIAYLPPYPSVPHSTFHQHWGKISVFDTVYPSLSVLNVSCAIQLNLHNNPRTCFNFLKLHNKKLINQNLCPFHFIVLLLWNLLLREQRTKIGNIDGIHLPCLSISNAFGKK